MKNVKYRMKCRLVATTATTTTHHGKHLWCLRKTNLGGFEFDSEFWRRVKHF